MNMVQNMFQTTTNGILHFEDLEPKIFEEMCYNILETSGLYTDFRPYGTKGADEGVDILCVEKASQLRYFVQCKRYKRLSTSDLYKIVDRISEGRNDIKGQVLLVMTSCDVTKKAYENYESYAIAKGFSKAKIIGRVLLDSRLHTDEYRLIRERFFGNSFDAEERARKNLQDFKKGKELVETKLLKDVNQTNLNILKSYLEHPELRFKDSEIIVRSIYDLYNKVYPKANKDSENSTWFKSELHDLYSNGIQLYLTPWITETIVVTPNGSWMQKAEYDKIKYEGETLELKVNVIGRIPYYNILEINDGDNIFPYPHLYCRFEGNHGPFDEICYEYVDYLSYERILFEKGKRALISEHDFQRIKDRVSHKHIL